jgi:hypothetical protein
LASEGQTIPESYRIAVQVLSGHVGDEGVFFCHHSVCAGCSDDYTREENIAQPQVFSHKTGLAAYLVRLQGSDKILF